MSTPPKDPFYAQQFRDGHKQGNYRPEKPSLLLGPHLERLQNKYEQENIPAARKAWLEKIEREERLHEQEERGR